MQQIAGPKFWNLQQVQQSSWTYPFPCIPAPGLVCFLPSIALPISLHPANLPTATLDHSFETKTDCLHVHTFDGNLPKAEPYTFAWKPPNPNISLNSRTKKNPVQLWTKAYSARMQLSRRTLGLDDIAEAHLLHHHSQSMAKKPCPIFLSLQIFIVFISPTHTYSPWDNNSTSLEQGHNICQISKGYARPS